MRAWLGRKIRDKRQWQHGFYTVERTVGGVRRVLGLSVVACDLPQNVQPCEKRQGRRYKGTLHSNKIGRQTHTRAGVRQEKGRKVGRINSKNQLIWDFAPNSQLNIFLVSDPK